jgi:hypothetical protein
MQTPEHIREQAEREMLDRLTAERTLADQYDWHVVETIKVERVGNLTRKDTEIVIRKSNGRIRSRFDFVEYI